MIVEISIPQFEQLIKNKAIMEQIVKETKGKSDKCSEACYMLAEQYVDVADMIKDNIKEG